MTLVAVPHLMPYCTSPVVACVVVVDPDDGRLVNASVPPVIEHGEELDTQVIVAGRVVQT